MAPFLKDLPAVSQYVPRIASLVTLSEMRRHDPEEWWLPAHDLLQVQTRILLDMQGQLFFLLTRRRDGVALWSGDRFLHSNGPRLCVHLCSKADTLADARIALLRPQGRRWLALAVRIAHQPRGRPLLVVLEEGCAAVSLSFLLQARLQSGCIAHCCTFD